jgi:hypothetical protein
MVYDHFDNDKQPISLQEFVAYLKECADWFESDFTGEGVSDFMKTKHTYNEWIKTFGNWMSF